MVEFEYGQTQRDMEFHVSPDTEVDFLWGNGPGDEIRQSAERIKAEYYPRDEKLGRAYDKHLRRFRARKCAYCRSQDAHYAEQHQRLEVAICRRCGWWSARKQWAHLSMDGMHCYQSFRAVVRGKLRVFDTAEQDTPYQKAVEHLALGHARIAETHPRHVEQLVTDMLREALPCKLELTKQSKDGGYDILGFESEGGPFLVEVKRYQRPVGVEVIRELTGVLFREGMSRGLVVSAASGFTSGARQEASEIAVTRPPFHHGIRLEFMDAQDVAAFLDVRGRDFRSRQLGEAWLCERAQELLSSIARAQLPEPWPW